MLLQAPPRQCPGLSSSGAYMSAISLMSSSLMGASHHIVEVLWDIWAHLVSDKKLQAGRIEQVRAGITVLQGGVMLLPPPSQHGSP